ncbi:glutamine--fructose-6-phosphate transaminase (isomerizing) [Candidatus Borrarchaeum sp.]|uniref:glutamine--fructose-6-phosphate transaminase (isomerizing) n=1 Tax=Candidatus Borrarchaeum sp. TaxID=2846742 RepID=UPI002580928C|nr:glutamine--fructose-6-phosphate transaminase (isomerizing) [Candidatus Borrarchaeum sp.]
MCGIVGIVLNQGNVAPLLRESLKRLEYRGYDSVGMATIANAHMILKKDKGKIDVVNERLNLDELPGSIGIAHTRWATHGIPTKENAHPHTDCKEKIAVNHNGIIENFVELRKELTERGHHFKSDTDTEVVPHLIEEFMEQGLNLKDATIQALRRIKGSYGLTIISAAEPRKIICARNGSPLVLGIGDQVICCASDIPAFLPLTNKAIILHDEELAVLTPNEYQIFSVPTQKMVSKDITTIKWTPEMASKGGYSYFMLKEIHEQPKALRDTLRQRPERLEKIAEVLDEASKIFITAAGTSFHAALTARYLFSQLCNVFPTALLSSEFPEAIGPSFPSDAYVIAVSQSGETADTIRTINFAKEREATIISVVNTVDSSITRLSDHVIYTQAGPEIGVAATKTFTTQVATLSMIALNLALRKKCKDIETISNLQNALYKIPNIVQTVITKEEEHVKRLAEQFAHMQNFLFLGRGINTTTAAEGSLKLKEISYVHAEAYPAGESKHGPIALITPGFPIMFIAPPDETYDHIIGNIMEMKAREGTIIAFIDEQDQTIRELADHSVNIPSVPPLLSPIPYVVPLQLFSYYAAVKLGYSPDMPRSLSKSVTVL